VISGDQADAALPPSYHKPQQIATLVASTENLGRSDRRASATGVEEKLFDFVLRSKSHCSIRDDLVQHLKSQLFLTRNPVFAYLARSSRGLVMKICFATSECVPYVKTGGLADVSGALPIALDQLDCEVKLFLPLYQSIDTLKHELTFCADIPNIPVEIGNRTYTFNTWHGHLPGTDVAVYLIDCPHYFHRTSTYTNHQDEGERFIFFQHAIFKVLQKYNWSPDVFHCNDWQTGLIPALARHTYGWDDLFKSSASIYSIHNIAYQGRFSPSVFGLAGIGRQHFEAGGPYELHGSFCFMKSGIHSSDKISTVSETYAQEIQTAELGADMQDVLRSRSYDLVGILNGIDADEWNPATDALIPHTYTADTLQKKAENKRLLLERFGLPYDPDVPLLGIVSRLAVQKGFELLQPIVSTLIEQEGVQFVMLGSGEYGYEEFFRRAAEAHPNNVGVYIGYNDELSHWIEAGSDMFLMPSRYEPCGLNQMYSLKYGTIPIVRKTGGLADTVADYHEHHRMGNGFSFVDFTPFALFTSIMRALHLFRDKDAWTEVQRRGMAADFSWDVSAERYLELYRWAIERRRGGY
jgi:starch synthase